MEVKTLWRRFEVIDAEKEDKLLSLIKQKNLSREDLSLILSAIKIMKETTE